MYNIIKNVINGGRYNADELVEKIDTFWVQGKLTNEQREELIQCAYDNCRDMNQVDVMAKLADLERRVYALENPVEEVEGEPEVTYPTWESGHITTKGEILWFDHDNDGEPSLFLYDGGRATTSLGVGKIAGWYILDPETLQPTHSYYKGVATPIESEPEQTEEPGEETTEPAGEGE